MDSTRCHQGAPMTLLRCPELLRCAAAARAVVLPRSPGSGVGELPRGACWHRRLLRICCWMWDDWMALMVYLLVNWHYDKMENMNIYIIYIYFFSPRAHRCVTGRCGLHINSVPPALPCSCGWHGAGKIKSTQIKWYLGIFRVSCWWIMNIYPDTYGVTGLRTWDVGSFMLGDQPFVDDHQHWS